MWDDFPVIISEDKIISGNNLLVPNSLMIGELLAKELGVHVGQTILVQSSKNTQNVLTLQGIFKTGIDFMDRSIGYADLKSSQSLLKMPNMVTSIILKLKDVWKAQEISADIARTFQLKTDSWYNSDYGVWEALKMQDRIAKIIQAFSLGIIVVGISGALLLNVYERKSEIGIMRSFGMTKNFVSYIFLMQGFLASFVGALLGCVLGYLFCSSLSYFKSANGQPIIPLDAAKGGYFMVALLTVTMSSIASLLPARIAANIDPLECIER